MVLVCFNTANCFNGFTFLKGLPGKNMSLHIFKHNDDFTCEGELPHLYRLMFPQYHHRSNDSCSLSALVWGMWGSTINKINIKFELDRPTLGLWPS